MTDQSTPSRGMKLLPCPFCGKPPEQCDDNDGVGVIACQTADCLCPSVHSVSVEEAAEFWNTREPPRIPDVSVVRDEIIEECAKIAEKLSEDPAWSPHYKNASIAIAGKIRRLAKRSPVTPLSGRELRVITEDDGSGDPIYPQPAADSPLRSQPASSPAVVREALNEARSTLERIEKFDCFYTGREYVTETSIVVEDDGVHNVLVRGHCGRIARSAITKIDAALASQPAPVEASDDLLSNVRLALLEICECSGALRQGGPDPMDLEGLSDRLLDAVQIAAEALRKIDGYSLSATDANDA